MFDFAQAIGRLTQEIVDGGSRPSFGLQRSRLWRSGVAGLAAQARDAMRGTPSQKSVESTGPSGDFPDRRAVHFGTAIAGRTFVWYRSMGNEEGPEAAGLPSPPFQPLLLPPDELARVLDETRSRFIATFVKDCDAIAALLEEALVNSSSGPPTDLTFRVHRLIGLPGTIGFPTISRRAVDLESLLGAGEIDAALARMALEKLRRAFTHDLANEPAMCAPRSAPATGIKILFAEDDADQQRILGISLATAGFLPTGVRAGDGVIETVRAERPALILLDIAMPGLDGYSVCRLLKSDPELKAIPVILMTTGASVHHRLAGLSLGADDFLSKPLDMRELILRIRVRLAG
jgi:CheY-like chemotaxis protein